MKQTYKVEPNGRIMIPIHIRKQLGINASTPVVIDVDAGSIRIRTAETVCFVCGKTAKKPSGMLSIHGNNGMGICSACLKKLEEEKQKRGEDNGND